jgi:hypothetical protein
MITHSIEMEIYVQQCVCEKLITLEPTVVSRGGWRGQGAGQGTEHGDSEGERGL